MALFSYSRESVTSDRDTVRMMLGDVDESVVTGKREEWSFYLTDSEIDRLLSLSGSDLYLAASRGCLALAASDLCMNKAVRLGQYATTNEAAAHWRELAATYRTEAGANMGCDTAEVAWDEFADAELRWNKAMRGESN
jgi:hypothetical protein